MDWWKSDCGVYFISQNYFDGKQWLFEVSTVDSRQKETWIADGKTLKEAKELAEFEREESEAMNV